jgi:Domain of unknown function (DUF4468) with TBP-like fold
MKFLTILAFMPLLGFAQKDPIDTARFYYSEIVEQHGASATTLQSRARVFLSEVFKDGRAAITLDDTASGVIIAKGIIVPVVKNFYYGTNNYGYVHFTTKLQFKDGKYKFEFSNFEHEGNGRNIASGGPLASAKPACGTFYMMEGDWRKVKKYVTEQVVQMAVGLKLAMMNAEIGSKKDNF